MVMADPLDLGHGKNQPIYNKKNNFQKNATYTNSSLFKYIIFNQKPQQAFYDIHALYALYAFYKGILYMHSLNVFTTCICYMYLL